MEDLPNTLFDLLCNALVLRQISPYIAVSDLASLSATSKQIRELLLSRPEPWRHLDLTKVSSAKIDSSPIDVGGMSWRAERMDEALTEDDFYAGPLRGIFSRLQRHQILRSVQTLILDGLSVPADLVRELVAEDRYKVKILSIRQAKNLNETKLRQVLQYAVRPTRLDGSLKLKALYFFGAKDAPVALDYDPRRDSPVNGSGERGITASSGAQIGAEWNHKSSESLKRITVDDETKWYASTGRSVIRPPLSGWSDTLQACRGLIAFDAVLCRGPRHDITKVESTRFLQPTIATVALGPTGCESCGTCPEGAAVFGASAESDLPLLSPPPLHSSTVRSAQFPQTREDALPRLIVRCEDCLRGRWCERCHRWWCEDCYEEPISRLHLQTEAERSGEARRNGPDSIGENGIMGAQGSAIKVYSNFCVEHCLVGEMMSGAGSNGMWG